jgi:Uma2 family endonuclease
MITYTINFDPVCKFTDEQFYQLCRKNPEIKFERNARGEIVIMSPTGVKMRIEMLKL